MRKKKARYFSPTGRFDLPPIHPGLTIAEELAARELSANALALKMRVPANRITEIINGRRGISAETALRLGRAFGNDAVFWINLQSQFDLAVAKRDFGKRIEKEVEAA